MSKFEYMRDFEVKDKTARFTLHAISVGDKSPTLIVKPASEANKPYFNALLKRAHTYAAQMQANKLTDSMVAENRDEDRDLYAKYVLADWENVVDADGAEVKFSSEAAGDFVGALPNWVFDDLRAFCARPVNFVDAKSIVDAGTSGKN